MEVALVGNVSFLSRFAIVVLSKFLVAFMCCPLVFEFSVGIGGFVIGLGQISFLFSFEILVHHALNAIIHTY